MEKWIIITSSVLLLAFICWKELRRKNKANLIFRLSASTLAVLALYFIAQPISFQRQLDPAKENTAVLLTEGFEKDSLAELKNIPVFSTDQTIAGKNKNVTFITDLEQFTGMQPDVNKIHILGNGLDQQELELLGNHQLIFHAAPVSGFNSVHWNHIIRSGERLIVQGNFKSPAKQAVKILFRGLSTNLDSVEIKGDQTFQLSTSPKLLDKAIYSLIALSGTDTLANEKVPVIIRAKQPLKILILSSSPDFESKFLKSWLYSDKYAVAVRASISKDKVSTEFLNTEKLNLNRISPSLLQNFDILIGDMAELSRMGATENAAIQNQVGKGMGLVIRADSAGGTGFYRRAFNLRQNRVIDQKSTALNWAGHSAKKSSPPAGQIIDIVPRPGEQVLVRDAQNHVQVSSKLYGAGRIIISTVPNTYTWMLANNTEDYSSYWSHILEKAARKTEAAESWVILNQFPVTNSQAIVRLESSSDSLPSAKARVISLHFAQDPAQLYRWTSPYWPSESGWQAVQSGNKESFWYVFDQNDWRSVRAAHKINNTAKFISSSNNAVKRAGSTIRSYTYTIPVIYFFILFLLSCTYLWLETKLN